MMYRKGKLAFVRTAADLGVLLQQRYGLRVRASEAAARAAVSRYEGEEIIKDRDSAGPATKAANRAGAKEILRAGDLWLEGNK